MNKNLVPVKSLSKYAKNNGKPQSFAFLIFYAPSNMKEEDIPCPFDPTHPKGNTIRCADIHLEVECKDGRRLGEENKNYEIACFVHSEASKRPPVPTHFTGEQETATCLICRQYADPDFVPQLHSDYQKEESPPLFPEKPVPGNSGDKGQQNKTPKKKTKKSG